MSSHFTTLLVLVYVLICFDIISTLDYCQYDSNHVFCDKASYERSPNCANTKVLPVNDDLKEKILQFFNSYRQRTALHKNIETVTHRVTPRPGGQYRTMFAMPPASDMIQLEWHAELEKAAQKISEYCDDNLKFCSACLQIDSMASTWAYNFLNENNIEAEYKNHLREDGKFFRAIDYPLIMDFNKGFLLPYKWRNNESFQFLGATLHSETKYIGCGRTTSWKPTAEYFETCIFAPLPKTETTILYKRGHACSNCPRRYVCSQEFKGLCTKSSKGIGKPTSYCKLHKKHVLCNDWNRADELGNPELCKGKTSIKLEEPNKFDILESYNNFRKDIALGRSPLIEGLPKAADMIELEWDKELQKTAETLLDICSNTKLDAIQLKFGRNGELQANVVSVFHNGSDFQEALSKVIGLQELHLNKSFIHDYKSDTKYDVLSSLAFSQTRYMGCARQNSSSFDAENHKLMHELCVFASTEGLKSTSSTNDTNSEDILYIEGRKCSKCPRGFQCNRGLCKTIDFGIDIPEDFCDLDPKHIMCDKWKRAEEIGDRDLCQGKTPLNVTELDKSTILDPYNKFRRDLALGKDTILTERHSTANMLELKWNEDLQEAAENILHICSTTDVAAGQLKFGHHGELQGRIIRLRHNGKNFQEKLKTAITNEGVPFDPMYISNYPVDGKDNLFTTLAFAQARYLGCARLTPAYEGSEPNEFEEVCIIGPTEKESGNNLYITGEACTNCPENYVCDEGLCERVQPGIDTPQDYCKLNDKHMLCFNWERGINYADSKKCNANTDQNKTMILSSANEFRRNLAFGVISKINNGPKVADMNELEWDNELADAAENIAHFCGENKISSDQMKFGHHGELNAEVIYIRHHGTDFEDAFLSSLEAGGIHLQDDGSHSAFKSLAYSKARFMGCAQQVKMNQTEIPNEILEICVVGPTVDKESMASLSTNGFPCSACRFGFECNDGLCKQKRFGIGESDNYCNIDMEHILCDEWINRAQDLGNAELCAGKTRIEISELDKAEILSSYNQIRRDLAYSQSKILDEMPKAADMNELIWDNSLQEAAENLLYVCSTKELRPEQLAFGPHGELQGKQIFLVHEVEDYAETLSRAVRAEARYFDKALISNYPVDEKYDMFTAIAFSKANYLGCARLKPSYKDPSLPNLVAEVCIIAGAEKNFTGHLNRLYMEGEECTECQYGFDCFNGLCRKSRNGMERPDHYCEVGSKHILCTEWDPARELGDASKCAGKKPMKITEQNKFEMVNSFNKFRKNIARGTSDIVSSDITEASNMFEIEWDKELHRAAQKIQHGCIPLERVSKEMLKFGHHGEFQTHKFFYVHDGTNFEEELKNKISEAAANFAIEQLDNYKADEQYDTFTSSAYSAARFLGCARSEMTEESDSINKYSELCIIGPIGKEENNQLFSKGEACSDCPPRSDCDDGLCKPIRVGIAKPEDYCELNTDHILCKKENQFENSKICNDETMLLLTNGEKSNVLSSYNHFRREIAIGKSGILQTTSGAANMIKLEYDYELEEAAESLLRNCDTESISPDKMTFGRHGELQANKITIVHDGSNFKEALRLAVEKEAQALNKIQLEEYEKTSMITTPYNGIIAPLISFDSRYLGCARRTPADQPNMITEICVIGGTKRYGDTSLYLSGDACSMCNPVYTCDEDLCRAPAATYVPDSWKDPFRLPESSKIRVDDSSSVITDDSLLSFSTSSSMNSISFESSTLEPSFTSTVLQMNIELLELADAPEDDGLPQDPNVQLANTAAVVPVDSNSLSSSSSKNYLSDSLQIFITRMTPFYLAYMAFLTNFTKFSFITNCTPTLNLC